MISSGSNLLEVQGVTKRYGEATVLNDCQLQVRAGEIHALLGGNGAGKSTLVRIIAGLVSPTAGEMKLNGTSYAPSQKREAEEAGVQIVQQEFNLIPTLSVAENLLLTRLPSLGGVINRKELHRRAKTALERLDLHDISTDAIVETLGVGQQQMIEIAAALDRQCKLLILDEPTAALSVAEVEALFPWLENLRAKGVGIIYISHRLDEVARLSDRITVLRDGQYFGTYETSQLTTDQMVDLMTGDVHNPASHHPNPEETLGEKSSDFALRVEGISGGKVQDVSFEVRRGERFGIAGLVGSGRTELLRLIFGADVASRGHIYLDNSDTPRRFRHPSEAVAAGLAMVTEDRKQNGLLLPQSIRANSTLAALGKRFSRWGVIRSQAEAESAESHRESMEIRCTSIEQHTSALSGGNQQKVVIARWLTTEASVFLFDEPTRGIDVPARRRIYRLIDTLADEGKTIVIVSSDLEELFETCDRIAVMSNGRLCEIFSRPDMSHDAIMRAAFSGYLDRSSHA
ncbi:sugar ABC transporter ATP-binding protein [Blastopirellula sp. JC732]|uniref:Sugar ABC transporter ATP-binding protein n=1 Tax=Blastopirellula sediminis TaxID=2894196 RepID=A0A9X1ML35_9BACT|nr:sugar ABC transporter ATP-binding protein [Blastopirellula sediminis]MCC9608647.1 sugar ABC transporter ATP-binding protein [Blastopirellula sediminis]MCC9628576.1 sugar ABC transporter ATP-binding protein [Blastopirellula sediminis]